MIFWFHSFSIFFSYHFSVTGFPGDTVIKNLPANAGDIETWVLSLGWEDPLR